MNPVRRLLCLLACSFVATPSVFSASIDLSHAAPAPNSKEICPDTPLRLVFPAEVSAGSVGKVSVFDAGDGRLVASVDVATPSDTRTIGGLDRFKHPSLILDGREACLLFPQGTLAYQKSYYVTIDGGAFKVGGAPTDAVEGASAWRFTTRSRPPAAGANFLTVAADGSGDFCTVQAALDFIPDGNTTPTTIFIRKGLYREIIFFTNKHALTLLGEDRKETVIACANNANFNSSGGNPFAGTRPDPSAVRPKSGGGIYRRGMILAHRVNDLTIANLTLRNTTPQGGSQAEALILNGTTTARAILRDLDLYSFQDTLQINGQAYVRDCFIQGDVDFLWGTGPCFFENCHARSVRSNAYYTQIRNPGTNHGYVFLRCLFDGLPGVMGNYFSRIEPDRFPHSEVVLLECKLGTAVLPVAWQLQTKGGAAEPPAPDVHFWEFASANLDGTPVDFTLRHRVSRRLSETADATLVAQYRTPSFVLGSGWEPSKAPIFARPLEAAIAAAKAKTAQARKGNPQTGTAPSIIAEPADQLALIGTAPLITVAAGGQGPLTYRWFKNGALIPGATAATLRIAHAEWNDGATYSVAVSNAAGTTQSRAARLDILAPAASPKAPDLPNIPDAEFPITRFGAVGDGTTDNTAAIKKAVAAALAAGGGRVVIPYAPKPYLSGPFALGDRIQLQIDAGAILRLLPYSPAPEPPAGFYPLGGKDFAHFLIARDAKDVALTGAGTIEGDGAAWWDAFRANKAMPHRPYIVRFDRCERVLVSGLLFRNSPMFHVALGAIKHLTVFGITIRSPEAPNTDGLDPSGEHQLIQNCDISVGDDNIAVKAGGAFCSDITIADCAFGTGHGLSVGGQSTKGLDGMTVKNCFFRGTVSGLRLKADPTQGGPVRNISYSNLTMENVEFPIVFYSYYNKVGNPGRTSGRLQTTPEKVRDWNNNPPNRLDTATLPSWKDITINHLTATGAKGFGIIWGLPLADGLISNVRLNNVRFAGGPGLEIFNALNVNFTGDTDVGPIVSANALALVRQPRSQKVCVGEKAEFEVNVAGTNAAPTFRWHRDGQPLQNGATPSGARISGADSSKLVLENAQSADAGKYSVNVSAPLDLYDVPGGKLAPANVSTMSTAAALTVTAR